MNRSVQLVSYTPKHLSVAGTSPLKKLKKFAGLGERLPLPAIAFNWLIPRYADPDAAVVASRARTVEMFMPEVVDEPAVVEVVSPGAVVVEVTDPA